MRVLIADDDSIMQLFLAEVLAQEGHDVSVVADGEAALEAMLSDTPPQIVIMDWMMPKLDGLEVVKSVRQKRPLGEMYVIVVTAVAERGGVVTALESGADDFLSKPCGRAELVARVRAGERIVKLQDEKSAMLWRLQHAQRLESIGQLAAGIAHEINTPVQYIGDNTRFIKEAVGDILDVIEGVTALAEAARDHRLDDRALERFEAVIEAADFAFLSEQIPLAVEQSLDGLAKVSDIVRAMKEFSHPGTRQMAVTDLNHMVESMVTVTRNEWKYVSDVELALDERISGVPCLAGELSQAIINLIVNSAQSIAEKKQQSGSVEKGRILVETRAISDAEVEIRISDTGAGIPELARERVFEPFFTTKEVGKGTGQGLALAYAVVVEKHLGRIFFETETGKGTTFIIRLPRDASNDTGDSKPRLSAGGRRR